MKQRKYYFVFASFLFLGGFLLLSGPSEKERLALLTRQVEEYSNIIDKLQTEVDLKGYMVDSLQKELELLQRDFKARTHVEFRLTSYYPGDPTSSGRCTGSGLCIDKFILNDKGWYTYNNMVVLGAATENCLTSRTGACGRWNTRIARKHYFRYYDKVILIIDGVEYAGIVLDSCGACMTGGSRIDLFVKDKASVIDRGHLGRNPIKLSW